MLFTSVKNSMSLSFRFVIDRKVTSQWVKFFFFGLIAQCSYICSWHRTTRHYCCRMNFHYLINKFFLTKVVVVANHCEEQKQWNWVDQDKLFFAFHNVKLLNRNNILHSCDFVVPSTPLEHWMKNILVCHWPNESKWLYTRRSLFFINVLWQLQSKILLKWRLKLIVVFDRICPVFTEVFSTNVAEHILVCFTRTSCHIEKNE